MTKPRDSRRLDVKREVRNIESRHDALIRDAYALLGKFVAERARLIREIESAKSGEGRK